MTDALSKFYARYGLKPKSAQERVARSSADQTPREKPASARPRAEITAVTSRGAAQPAGRPAAPPPENIAAFVPTSARSMPVANDPHEVAMSLPAQSFLAKCDRCGKDKGNDEQRFCFKCALKKNGGVRRGLNPPREVPPPATTERATLAVATAAAPRLFLKECTTVDAESGSKCKLLAPHPGYPCRNERGVIRQALLPGELPRREMAVVLAANRSSGRSDIAAMADGPLTAARFGKTCSRCGNRRKGDNPLCWDCRHDPNSAALNPGGSDGH